jgi:phage gp46-like protein
MMGDLKLTITNGRPDITLTNEKPDMTDGLFNSVFLSLFASPGWINRVTSDRYSSTLPEIMTGPLTTETRNNAIEAARSALAWMIHDGIADEIEVEAETVGSGRLNIRVKIVKPEATESFVYALNWDAQEVEVL